jgi:hypothetical protein
MWLLLVGWVERVSIISMVAGSLGFSSLEFSLWSARTHLSYVDLAAGGHRGVAHIRGLSDPSFVPVGSCLSIYRRRARLASNGQRGIW